MGGFWESVKTFFEETEEEKEAKRLRQESYNQIEQMVLQHNQLHRDRLAVVRSDGPVSATAPVTPLLITCPTGKRGYHERWDAPFGSKGVELCTRCGQWHLMDD